jgi:hypothetical protein
MSVTVDIDEDDGTVTVIIDPASEDWTYTDEYGRLQITVPKPKEGANDDRR